MEKYFQFHLQKGLSTLIITIQHQVSIEERNQLETLLEQVTGNHKQTVSTLMDEREVIVLDSSQLDKQDLVAISQQRAVESVVEVKTQYQLVSKAFKAESSRIEIGDAESGQQVIIGGSNTTPVVIAGPCAVENREQLLNTALAVKAAGAQILRGGAFKPRTSPYQFQGLGIEGLHYLKEARELTGLPVITEVMEPEMVAITFIDRLCSNAAYQQQSKNGYWQQNT
jgi:3-deoxy-7-phosphoheptulonate synthase